MSKRTPPEILSCQTVAQSKLFAVEALDLRFSNGELRTYCLLYTSDAADDQ